MSSETKHYCDRCGKEIARGQHLSLAASDYGKYERFDFCAACEALFRKFMEPGAGVIE